MMMIDDWEEFYAHYVSLYGIHLLIGVLLSAVTVFRRELSCNRVFHQEEKVVVVAPPLVLSPDNSFISDELEEEAEELLDGAGMYYCSGPPIRQFSSLWADWKTLFSRWNYHAQEPLFSAKLLQKGITPSDFLDRVGNYYSAEPISTAMALILYQKVVQQLQPLARSPSSSSFDPLTNNLPTDVHVNITSFLHPKDVLSLSCVSRTYRNVVDHSETSNAIWKTQWQRDYAWIVQHWNIGKEAFQRSQKDEEKNNNNNNTAMVVVDKEFYFRFGQTYLNYVLAGHNTVSSCLVGLHCQIYDITSFLNKHPGSPDTLMVHAGRDATRFFEDIGHSQGARRLAKRLCVVADLSQVGGNGDNDSDGDDYYNGNGTGWGLRPTPNTVFDDDDDNDTATSSIGKRELPPIFEKAGEGLRKGRKQFRQGGTLNRIRVQLESELANVEHWISKTFEVDNDTTILGTINPYYDPFRREWRVWYTDANLQTVFLPV